MLRPMGALGLCCLLLTGCVDPAKRALIAEETEKAHDLDVRLIGEVTEVGNGGPMRVDGVGLVTGLPGTGHCPIGFYRNLMEQELLKHSGPKGGEIAHLEPQVRVRQVLDNPCNALVIVTGFIPAGARRGDRFDVNIRLAEDSKASSLVGGFLELCSLRVYEAEGALAADPKLQSSRKLLQGHIFAHAKGALVVGFGNNTDPNELKHARVWQGGVSHIDRPYIFALKPDPQSLQIASRVATRMNSMYQEDPQVRARQADYSNQEKQLLLMGYATHQLNEKDAYGMGQGDVAKASKDSVIFVRVPTNYRLDHARFVNVASLTPLPDVDQNLARYIQRLQKMLLDPRDTRRAAVRLEALGRDRAIPILQTGLEDKNPFVRFCSAEAMAYLGNTAGVDTLIELAQKYPLFAKHATTALANLGENICRDRLADLFASDEPALRCAAFHALTQIDETDKRLGGFCPKEAFWLYRVPQAPTPMVYFSTSKRPQIVLFGAKIALQPGKEGMMIGKEFTIAQGDQPNQFRIKRITVTGEQQRLSTGNLGEILTNLADLGATYTDIVDFLRKARDYQKVNCPIVPWTIPDVSLEQLVEEGRNLK